MDLSRRKCIIFATNFSVTMETRSYKYISNINSPIDLKAVSREELPQVCDELRQFIIDEVSKNPGHLGSSLGVVELTLSATWYLSIAAKVSPPPAILKPSLAATA
jgi:hypothetical protein